MTGPHPVTPKTLADVIRLINADPRLDDGKKRQWRSSLKRFAELAGKTPGPVPASIEEVRHLAKTMAVAHFQMSRGSFHNMRSHVKAALGFYGIGEHKRRRFADLMADWKQLRELCKPVIPFPRLSNFFHYCSERRIAPDEVTQETFEAYRAHLLATRVKGKPENAYSLAVTAWNKGAANIDGWPALTVHRESRRSDYTLPLDRFSKSFQDDFHAKFERVENPDPFDELAPDKPSAPKTIKTVKHYVMACASAMTFAGRPIEEIRHLSDLLEVEEFKRAIQWLLENRHGWSAGDAVPDSIREIAKGIARYGRHWMVVDAMAERPNDPEAALRRIDDHMAKLQAVVKKLGKRKFGMTEKNRELLRKFEDPMKELAILELPDTLADPRALRKLSPARAALQVQTAVAVEILLFGAPRMKNLVGLRIDRHLKFADPRSKLPTHIVLSEQETKNEVAQEITLSRDLARRLTLYLEHYRLVLADEGCPYLFPGQNRMDAKTDVALRDKLAQVLRDHVGVNMTPHQFRHLSAWIWLKDHPGEFAQVQHFLHHKNIETTIRTYAGFDRAAAVIRHGEFLESKRGDVRSLPTRPHGS